MKCVVNAWAISSLVNETNGIANENFVKLSCMVSIYDFLDLVGGNGPTISMDILSKASSGVSVIIIGSLVLIRTSFFF